MQALEFWKAVKVDRSDFLERIIALLEKNRIRFCVVGGQAVNAYAEPVVSIDLDIAVAVEDLSRAETLLRESFSVREFPHSLNVAAAGSDLRVKRQKDLADIARLLESHPHLRPLIPREILDRLF